MGEHLRTAPFPILAVYGALDEGSMGHRLASFMEKTRLKPLRWARDHALPLKKLSERRYDTYTPGMILKKGWTAKHQEQIPGGLLVVYETDSLNTISLNAAVGLLERVKANVVTSGRSSIPVALAVVSTSPEPESAEEKATFFSQLKKITMNGPQAANANPNLMTVVDRTTLRTPAALNYVPPCGLLVISHLELEREIVDALHKFRTQLLESIHDYYKAEIARIKAIRRGDRRAGAIALKARHEFKCAQYYEMRSLPEKALTHYQEAFAALTTLASNWEREETSEYHAHEIRSAAEIVHYRMCALRLEAGEPRLALAQLRQHLRSMSPLLDSTHNVDEYWEWMSRQHVLFAGLLSSTSTSSLTVAFGALDPCERERCSGIFHLSRAAMYAKKISKPERALDLIERLVEAFARRKKIHTRREAALLISVAEERFRVGDELGALRDMERAAAVFLQSQWFHLYVRVLSTMDSMFKRSKSLRSRPPSYRSDFECQFVILYGENEHQKQEATEYLLVDKVGGSSVAGIGASAGCVSIETSLLEATLDEVGRRLLLSSKFPNDIAIRTIQCSEDSDMDFGLRRVADFSDEHALVPALGSLMYESTDDFSQLQSATTILLLLSTGAKWKLPLKAIADPAVFALRRSDPLSKRIENHRRAGWDSQTSLAAIKEAQHNLVCKGFPLGNVCLLGESFHVECSVDSTVGSVTEKCLIECDCETPFVKIHATTTRGKFIIELCPTTEALFMDQVSKAQVHISAFLGTMQLAKRVVELEIVWPIVLGLCRRVGTERKCVIELECNSVAVNVTAASLAGLEGRWDPSERRSALCELSRSISSKIDLTFERCPLDQALPSEDDFIFNSVGSWNLTLPLPELDENLSLRNNLVDDMQCQVSFKPAKPFLILGQEVVMTMFVRHRLPMEATGDVSMLNTSAMSPRSVQRGESDNALPLLSPVMKSLRILAEPTSGFFASGPEMIQVNLYPGQETWLEWRLYPFEVGPQRLPGAWVELVKEDITVSRRRVECIDSFCLVLPSKTMIDSSST